MKNVQNSQKSSVKIAETPHLPLISVIVPIYNVASYIERCFNSLIQQTYPYLEIILIDDGSTDEGGELCQKLVQTYQSSSLHPFQVKFYHQTNQGLSATRNFGLKHCTGEFVAFVDSDDMIAPDMIELLYHLCSFYQTQLSICNFQEFHHLNQLPSNPHFELVPAAQVQISTSQKHGVRKIYAEKTVAQVQNNISQKQPGAPSVLKNAAAQVQDNISQKPQNSQLFNTVNCLKSMLLEQGFNVSAWGKLYHRSLFERVRFPVGALHEDVGTTYRLIDQCPEVAYSPQKKYYYFQNPTSITKQSFNKNKLKLLALTDEMCDFLDQKYPDLHDATRERRMHARFSILRQTLLISHPDQITKQAQNQVIQYLKTHRTDILDNPVATKRDRLALRALLLHKNIFKLSWQLYQKLR